ncbi:hypothetical protein C8J57DRAFT_1528780 [Mycena rebaudengoi]|nr:hypothetical protein C8J57DRAFT_1528780 [Mycena rebaudengoi]
MPPYENYVPCVPILWYTHLAHYDVTEHSENAREKFYVVGKGHGTGVFWKMPNDRWPSLLTPTVSRAAHGRMSSKFGRGRFAGRCTKVFARRLGCLRGSPPSRLNLPPRKLQRRGMHPSCSPPPPLRPPVTAPATATALPITTAPIAATPPFTITPPSSTVGQLAPMTPTFAVLVGLVSPDSASSTLSLWSESDTTPVSQRSPFLGAAPSPSPVSPSPHLHTTPETPPPHPRSLVFVGGSGLVDHVLVVIADVLVIVANVRAVVDCVLGVVDHVLGFLGIVTAPSSPMQWAISGVQRFFSSQEGANNYVRQHGLHAVDIVWSTDQEELEIFITLSMP